MTCPIASSHSIRGRKDLITILIVILEPVLTGCVPVTTAVSDNLEIFSCNRFELSHWQEFDFGPSSSFDDFFATVHRLYEIDSDNLLTNKNPEGQLLEVIWTDNDSEISANFTGGGQLLDIHMRWDREQPTLAQVINCLGPPDNQHEVTNSEGTESENMSYWAVEKGEKSEIPGHVTMLVLEGVSWLSSESSPQASNPEFRLKELTIFAFPVSQVAIETPEISSCAKISVSRWQEFGFGVDSSADVYANVVNLWGNDKGQILVGGIATEEFPPVRWNDAAEEIFYTAYFPDGHLGRISVLYNPAFALFQVIECLGPPEYYESGGGAGHEGTSLSLWYVERGFVIAGIAWHRWPWQKHLEAIPPDFGLYSFHVLPAEIEQMARSFNYLDDEGNPDLCVLRPWPGSIEAIEIEDFFAPCSESGTE